MQHRVLPKGLGGLLTSKGLLKEDELFKALDIQEKIGGRLGAILIRLGAISENILLPVLAEQLQGVLLSPEDLPYETLALEDWLREHSGRNLEWWLAQEAMMLPPPEGESPMLVAKDHFKATLLEVIFQRWPEGYTIGLLRAHDLDTFFAHIKATVRHKASGDENNSSLLRELAEEAPVIEFVNNVFAQAVDANASDIHVEPQKQYFVVRYRIDGVLVERFRLPIERFSAIASRIKLISGIDIAERRLPQDGRIRTRVSGKEFDIRVSTAPAVKGESLVLRLLPAEKANIDLANLGMTKRQMGLYDKFLSHSNGIILVTGPTGSGKSTTLYAGLEKINDGKTKILTVEDPVEYQIDGVTQVQANSDIGYTFARALRSFLRQDPDVIMVGEIRDLETAEISIQSSLTGHLVLSTLHTNDSISAFARLIDMGIEPFLATTPLRGIIAQRLVRRVCTHCSDRAKALPYALLNSIQPFLQVQGIVNCDWRQAGKGCSHCQHTGYKGRLGIYEMIDVDDVLREMIVKGVSLPNVWESLKEKGVADLRTDGLVKAAQGLTTVEEVLRITA